MKRKYGAVIVKDDVVISTGYNGSPRGFENCCDIGKCPRMERDMHQGEGYGICFGLSAFMKKNKLGLPFGIVLILYIYDLMARVVPDLSDYKVVSPFSYANAADILSTSELSIVGLVVGVVILIAGICVSCVVYGKRDLAT